jgi:hypothetical protein
MYLRQGDSMHWRLGGNSYRMLTAEVRPERRRYNRPMRIHASRIASAESGG